jgi:uncharacterized protein (DUF1697 family)
MAQRRAVQRYIAFLRGINVGGHRVTMQRLREVFEELGLANVATFIASGNVIFDAPASVRDPAELEARIEKRLHAALGYEVPTFLRTPAEVAAVVAHRPFAAAEMAAAGNTLHVAMLRSAPGKAAAKALVGLRTAKDEFHVRGRELYWLCRGRTSDSLVKWQVLDKALAMPATMRNIKMLRKLAALYPPDAK